MRTNKEYKIASKAALPGNWPVAVLASLIFVFASVLVAGGENAPLWLNKAVSAAATAAGAGSLIAILVLYPLAVGYLNAFRKLYEDGDKNVLSNMFGMGFSNYLHVVWTYFLMAVKILLWTLLLVIPGLIKAFAYALVPYIVVEHPELSASETISLSCKMMAGHKVELLMLFLSFFGWFIVGALTLGIGYLWIIPYIDTAVAAFYNDLKAKDIVFEAEIVD